MPQRFLVNLDLEQNQLLNALLQVLAADPGTPAEGQFWYRSDDDTPRFRTGSATRRLAEVAASGAVSVTHNPDGTVTVDVNKAAVDALDVNADTVDNQHAADLLARANHTGTQGIATISGLQTELDGKANANHGHTIGEVANLASELNDMIRSTEKGAADGVAELDANSKLPVGQLPDVALGGLSYQGTWSAATNTPALYWGEGSVPAAGVFYKVSHAGSANLSGITDWRVGDWAISDGENWQKIDNTDQVSSVAGKSGAVTLDTADIDGLVDDLAAKADLNGNVTFDTLHVGDDVDGRLTILNNGAGAIQLSVYDPVAENFAGTFYFYTDGSVPAWIDGDGLRSIVLDDDARLSDAREPTDHGHAIGDVTDLWSMLGDRPVRWFQVFTNAVGPQTVTHNLGNTILTVDVFDDNTGEKVGVDVTVIDANSISVDWTGTQSLRVVVHA